MGEMADCYMELAMQQEAEFEAECYFIQEQIKQMEKQYMMGVLKWNTQSGGRIMVTKMTKEHLENTIAFIKRGNNEEVSQKWIELLKIEIDKR